MSNRYKGAVISATPPTTSTSAASGAWTLEQQMQAQAAGTWPSPPIFIEDLFSTYLYTGNGSTQTITNGIDLSGQGGLVWSKDRTGTNRHRLYDTVRGGNKSLTTDGTEAQDTWTAPYVMTFNNNGYVTGLLNNESGPNYVSWTFREQPKFFDIVTYTGDGIAGRTVAHNLGSVPGCMIVKCVTQGEPWYVYHQSLGNTKTMVLNTTDAEGTDPSWNNTTPTASVFTVGSNSQVNFSGRTYIAYLFAHNAGGFPVSGGGSTNGISCGSYTGNGSSAGPVIDLGYEPQWLLVKQSSSSGNSWSLYDTMRGFSVAGPSGHLRPNDTAAEDTTTVDMRPTATGFQPINSSGRVNGSGSTYIYIAIRRGPMKTPTVGTSVFSPVVRTGTSAAATVSTTNLTDMSLIINKDRSSNSYNIVSDRLRGPANTTSGSYNLSTNDTVAEYLPAAATVTGFNNNNVTLGTNDGVNYSGSAYINYFFSRAPGFFDEVCYTGTGANASFTHNLGVVPEMMIVKGRSVNANWAIYTATTGATQSLFFTDVAAGTYSVVWNDTAPTASVFTVGTAGTTNTSSGTYVAYLFATVAGVSKVGSYTGTGALQTVNCGFTSGARFLLIKRTDSTGDWYVYDSARGITSGNDPYLLLNSTAAEVTGTNYVDTISSGFQVTAAAPAGLNANGGNYIFLAIA